MAVRIGHASIDENGKAAGGRAGDQTGRELVTREWYSKGWNVLLRPVGAALAEKSAAAMEAACKNENIGYDQGGRNTLYSKAKAAGFDLGGIETPCECDCSSLVHVCAIAGGAKLSYDGGGLTTRTMVRAFLASGDYTRLTGSEYLTSDKYLQRGDILVKEGSHTAMVLSYGAGACCALQLPVLRRGAAHDTVRAAQQLLLARGYDLPVRGADSRFSEETENALLRFQQDMNLQPDGICGTATWRALLGIGGVG